MTHIKVTTSGRLPHSEVEATIALTKRLAPGEDPARVAELLRTEAQALLGGDPRRLIGSGA